MFSVLARSRALAFTLFFFPAFVHSREQSLFASSVTYCKPPESLLVQQFDIAFFPKNQSVAFNISAASVKENVNVTANLFLNVYGMNPVNFTLDLCHVLNGALCPLPTYNFVGADSITLPDSLGVSDKVPGIAFVIPDLEGFAQLTLTEIGTGDVKACIQATLSNGWSTHQPAVEWVTAGFALAAFVSAIFHSAFPDSLAPFRFLDLVYLYQAIASSSFLGINYPSLYRAFTLNFAWAVGLVSTSSSSSFQNSIDNMRRHTGGRLANSSSSSAVGLINRKLSPYNAKNSEFATAPLVPIRRSIDGLGEFLNSLASTNLRVTESARPDTPNLRMNLAQVRTAVQGEVQTVTSDSSNVLQAGIPIFTNSIHIGTGNAFMTVFLVSLIVLAVGLALLALGYLATAVVQRMKTRKGKNMKLDYPSFTQAWLVRLGLVFLFPLLVFAFYQWTLKDSWLSTLLSVISFLGLLVLLTYPSYLIIKLVRQSKDPYELHSTSPASYLASLGPLYAQYRPERYHYFLTLLIVPFLKAIFIAFASASGLAQVILLFVTEFIVLGLQIGLKPHKTRGGDVLGTYLGLTRLVATGLLIAFVERTAVKPIPRTVIGVVIAVIWAVAVVILISDLAIYHMALPLWQVLTGRFRHEPHSRDSPPASDSSMLEKGSKKSEGDRALIQPVERDLTPAPSWDRITASHRPLNPTPDHNIPLDPEILQAYPISPTESVTTGHGSTLPSLYSRDSGTITVGSLLPRRWSFSTGLGPGESQPGSPSAYSQLSGANSRPQSATQSLHSRGVSYHSSQPSSPSTPGNHSDESTNLRLQVIQEQPSQSSGLDVLNRPQSQLRS